MESKVNYALVGAFVIVFAVLGIVIILWLVGASNSTRDYKEYIVCTKESVSGLHRDSPVKYKGLAVGRVLSIKISKKNPDYLKIYALIKKSIPVTNHTVAKISSNGLTGISYINLFIDKKVHFCPNVIETEPYTIIPTEPSTVEKILQSVPNIAEKINQIADKINKVLDNNTQQNLKETLKNLSFDTAKLREILDNFNKFLKSGDILERSLDQRAFTLDRTLENINKLTKESQRVIGKFDNTTLDESYRAMKNLNETLIQLKQLIIEIRRNPKLILKGRKP